MNCFFSQELSNTEVTLDKDESYHCIKALRMRNGDEVFVTNGKGEMVKGTISVASFPECKIRVTDYWNEYHKKPYHLHIAISPTQQSDRFDWFVSKATEIGIDEITPLLCHRTERKTVKTDRLNGILLSAMKQSLQAYLPKLNEPAGFDEIVSASVASKKLIASGGEKKNRLKDFRLTNEKILILIGPEGDFTSEESARALKNNFIPVSLGASRLRTETAGVVCAALIAEWCV